MLDRTRASRSTRSDALDELGVEAARVLPAHRCTARRTSTSTERLRSLLARRDRDRARARAAGGLQRPPAHPAIGSSGFGLDRDGARLRLLEPFGFFDFVALERDARCVLTDSGTVQEECCILGVPNVTVRDATERPETIECGSNMLSGTDPEAIGRCVRVAVERDRGGWQPPSEYLVPQVSPTVAAIVTGHIDVPAPASGVSSVGAIDLQAR